MFATEGLLLNQIPPDVGLNEVVFPKQMILLPVMVAVGFVSTFNGNELLEIQPVEVSVKVKVAVPKAIALTYPELFTVATEGLLLTQIPPEVG